MGAAAGAADGGAASSLRFSWPLMQAAFVDYISVTGYVMLAGLRMSVADLGRFRMAQRLIDVLQEIAFLPARKVFMPVFVAVRHEPERRFEATRQMLDLLSMVIFFVSAVCGAAAKPIVLLMFGARWEAAVPVFAILTLMAPVTALYGVINPLLTAAGRTRLVSHFAWINAVSILLAAWFAAPYGLTTLAWALAGRGVLGVALFVAALKLGLERPAGPMLRLLALPCLGLVMARLGCLWRVGRGAGGGSRGTNLRWTAGVAAGVFGLDVRAERGAQAHGLDMTLRSPAWRVDGHTHCVGGIQRSKARGLCPIGAKIALDPARIGLILRADAKRGICIDGPVLRPVEAASGWP